MPKMKTAILSLALIACAPCNGEVKVVLPAEKIEVRAGGGFVVAAEKTKKGVDIRISRGKTVLRVPMEETTGLDTDLSGCELRVSDVRFSGDFPEEVEVVFGYGKPMDPFEDHKQAMGTVTFRFIKGTYLERTRVDVNAKGATDFRKPVGKQEVEVEAKTPSDPFKEERDAEVK